MLAATLSPTYGIYSGYEHFENVPLREGSEEYLDSEKYEIKQRALDGPMLPFIARVNEIRRENPALQQLSNVACLETANDALIAYVKQQRRQRGDLRREHRPAQRAGGRRSWSRRTSGCRRPSRVTDLLSGERFDWRIGPNYVAARPVDAPGPRPARS